MRVAELYEPEEGDSAIFATHGTLARSTKCQWPNAEPGEKACEEVPGEPAEGSWLRFCPKHALLVEAHRSGKARALPDICSTHPHGTPKGVECKLCELLAFLALSPDERMAAGHSMRVSNTKGKQAEEVPKCRRCGRHRTLDPCRDCATPEERKHYPPPPGFTADEIEDTMPL